MYAEKNKCIVELFLKIPDIEIKKAVVRARRKRRKKPRLNNPCCYKEGM